MADKSAPFDINRPQVEGKAAAMLPSVGGPGLEFVRDASTYVAAMHASLGDNPTMKHQSSLDVAAKAMGIDVPQAYAYANFSFMPDAQNYGLMQWPGVNPDSLRKNSRENVAPQMIIRSRVADLARYAGISTHPWKPGWNITLREATD